MDGTLKHLGKSKLHVKPFQRTSFLKNRNYIKNNKVLKYYQRELETIKQLLNSPIQFTYNTGKCFTTKCSATVKATSNKKLRPQLIENLV